MSSILITILSLSSIGIVAAIILYLFAQKFKVLENPIIYDVEDALPAANCGGCGYPGCRNFAEACVHSDSLDDLYCPIGGQETMDIVANLLGKEVKQTDPRVAVIRCSGSFENRPRTNHYDGASSCAVASALYVGDTDCPVGCLSMDDCVEVCEFEAIYMNRKTGLPVVIDEKCTACGACVEACPRDIIELRKQNKKDRHIFVSCINKEKGGIARKYCSVACIGCTKCFKVCEFEAITMGNNLAFIDSDMCALCRRCVTECPTNAILEINFPPRRTKTDEEKKTASDKISEKVKTDIKE
ncbi:MAG: Fe-S cluster domain-containing protein [Bacteroidales bacterium]|nr:Fe-S cluster domain-containing protein [Bacteroidales bacterium]